MYRVQYYCPTEAPYWQDLTEGLLWKTPRQFPSRQSAESVCNSLIWRYHGGRVLDPWGMEVYRV